MSKRPINVVIVGGGTAGWMSAAALVKLLGHRCRFTLVESDTIGTVGVGEATLPHLKFFNEKLGIDENEFMRATNATYKLGIEFSNWGKKGDAYIHPFGDYGNPIKGIPFHHAWLHGCSSIASSANAVPSDHRIDEYSLPVMACLAKKFDYPHDDPRSILSTYSYAFHIDASQYAKYLRKFSEKHGVERIEGKVDKVLLHEDGRVTALQLENGRAIEGDLFIDCSGFRALLLSGALNVAYQDWSKYLPCDRAVAMPSEGDSAPPPYTKAIAQEAGWQWRIPLQHRFGNGYVYSSQFENDDFACEKLQRRVLGKPLADPNFLRFQAGRRDAMWARNCVGIGLSSGFLEPLESTSIYLIQIAIMKLVEYFPTRREGDSQALQIGAERDAFNREMILEFDRVRDFLILHYHATQRDDTEFWRYCKNMDIPDDLRHKMDLFKATGHIVPYEKGLFLEPSWVAVYLGQNIIPKAYHPGIAALSQDKLQNQLKNYRQLVQKATAHMPSHAEAISRSCDVSKQAVKTSAAARMSLYGARR